MTPSRPLIGLIVPPAAGEVPPEPPALYPELEFTARGLALPRLTPDGYDTVIGRTAALAGDLKLRGAVAVSLMGTSLSFYRGPAGNARVLRAMADATGLPVTTMTDSVLDALRALKVHRLAVATAYTDDVNRALQDYLEHAGFGIEAVEAMHLTEVDDVHAVSTQRLFDLGAKALGKGAGADALFISCGGLKTLPVVVPLEQAFGIPVITSATAGAWGAARLTGHSGRSPGHGMLFDV